MNITLSISTSCIAAIAFWVLVYCKLIQNRTFSWGWVVVAGVIWCLT